MFLSADTSPSTDAPASHSEHDAQVGGGAGHAQEMEYTTAPPATASPPKPSNNTRRQTTGKQSRTKITPNDGDTELAFPHFKTVSLLFSATIITREVAPSVGQSIRFGFETPVSKLTNAPINLVSGKNISKLVNKSSHRILGDEERRGLHEEADGY